MELTTPITQKHLRKLMKKMKKKSAGIDGLSQDKLVLGSKVLINPLLQIVNQSIRDGKFPSEWKEALVTPVLKKGDVTLKENFRPVSCLPAASKLLEMVVNEQMSDFLENNSLCLQKLIYIFMFSYLNLQHNSVFGTLLTELFFICH